MPRGKQKVAAPAFEYDSLPEADAQRIRGYENRIERRDLQRRLSWFGDGHDLFKVREIIAGKRFEAWVVAKTPYSVRTAYNLADAALMLHAAAGSAKFAELPPIKPSVAYLLAAGTAPQHVRDKYLPRLIQGVEVTLREVKADLPKPEVIEAQPDDEAAAAPMREPNPAVMAFAKGLRFAERRLIRELAERGQLDMIVMALDWIDADPRKVTDATADRLADHAAEAILETPRLAMPASATSDEGDDDDDGSPDSETRH